MLYRQHVIQANCYLGKILYRRMCTRRMSTRRMSTRRMSTRRKCTKQNVTDPCTVYSVLYTLTTNILTCLIAQTIRRLDLCEH